MKRYVAAFAAISTLTAGAALAQDFKGHIEAREGVMRVLAINLGTLGGMAKGEVDYDAEAAGIAADSIVAASMIHLEPLFPEGSGEGDMPDTAAKAEIWNDWDDFASKWEALGTAAVAMQTAAAEGAEAIGPAMGKLGGACKGCHDTYRASNN